MLLVSCGTDLKLHNCPSYDLVHTYRPADSSGQIRNVSWCKDGSWLALVPGRGCTEIIRTKDDVRLLQTILGVAQPTAAVFQRTTKRYVAMSTINGSVLIYDIKAKTVKKQFVKTGSTVTMLDWCSKDTHLVAGSTDGQVTVYSNTTNQKSRIVTVPDSKSVSVVRFHATQRSVLGTASDEGVVALWDINNEKVKMCLKPHKAPVTDLVFSSQNSKLMVSVALDRTFLCYDIYAGIVALPVMTDHPLSTVDMASDGHTVAIGSSRGTIYIYDLRKPENPLRTIAAHSGEIKKISYQPCALDSTADSLHITEEKPVEVEQQPSNTSIEVFHNMLADVNEFCTKNEETDQNEIKIKHSSTTSDSFLIGLADNFESLKDLGSFNKEKSEISNLGLSESVKKWLDAKRSMEIQSSRICESPGNEKISDIQPIPSVKISSSTPTQANKDKISLVKRDQLSSLGSSNISPIVTLENRGVTMEELNRLINNTVKEVVTEQITDLSESLSRFFLNLQLCFSKQFVHQESTMERLFDCYYGSAANSNLTAQVQQLQQENDFLRNKVNELMRRSS